MKQIEAFSGTDKLIFPNFYVSAATLLTDIRPELIRMSKVILIRGTYKTKDFPLAAGTTVKMAKGASLEISGPVSWIGTSREPIVFTSESEGWSHISILQSHKQASKLQHVQIEMAQAPLDSFPMGALNLYGGFYELDFLKFQKITKEDALNLVKANFIAKNITIEATASDAIDVDYSKGVFENIKIKNAGSPSGQGGDALDLSGSTIEVKSIKITKVRDKAFSVGEISKLRVDGADVTIASTAVAVKDGSEANFKNLQIDSVDTPFEVYIKKAWFDLPTTLVLSDKRFSQTVLDLCDKCSLKVSHE